jgi:uncharacterized membrane protein
VNVRSTLVIHSVILACLIALSIWGAFALAPDVRVPIHWDWRLRPDGWAGKTEVLVFGPAMSAFLGLVFALAPRLDPRGKNLERSFVAYRTVWLAIVSLMAILHITTVGTAAGWPIRTDIALPFALAFLLVAMGNVMGKVRSNHVLGVRTPWTLANEQVWNKTHRVTGRLFVLVGLVGFAAALLGSSRLATHVVGGGAIAVALFAVVHSYVTWRRIAPSEPS